jgi:hypothetical protein
MHSTRTPSFIKNVTSSEVLGFMRLADDDGDGAITVLSLLALLVQKYKY